MARRQLNPFALSFLDCMCCGFGAVILVFMIISAKIQAESEEKLEGLVSDRVLLESRVLAGERFLAQIRGNLARAFKLQAVATHMKARLQEDLFSTEHALQGEEVRAGDLQARLEAQKKLLHRPGIPAANGGAVGIRLPRGHENGVLAARLPSSCSARALTASSQAAAAIASPPSRAGFTRSASTKAPPGASRAKMSLKRACLLGPSR